ncbi:uncharacterized protein RJT21DRAFT_115312 [Scheffersomyces amazonensis]|uniref:uncharacterized protein n=1 Tax=Scheffersomyces amazonensis TaxID=1078765 RepID=UPI00315DC080
MQLYDRISTTDNELGTIKFIGQLPSAHAWAGTLVYGIEWDNSSRGKNDGTLDDVKYFEVDVIGAGSFMKANNKKICKRRASFIQSLYEEYHTKYEDQEIRFGTKIVDELGFDKLNRIQSNFMNLKSVSLSRKSIVNVYGDGDESSILNTLVNVINLDISFNLFNGLSVVQDIIGNLRNLSSLNLNGNRFFTSNNSPLIHTNLSILKLSTTLITIPTVNECILPNLPNLSELYLASNNYNDTDISHLQLQSYPNIQIIDLSFNMLTIFPSLPINTLLLSDNYISSIPNQIQSSIKTLDIRHNKLNSFKVIDELAIHVPNLTNLRINKNPVFEVDDEESMFVQLLARFNCHDHKESSTGLTYVNGSPLNNNEIQNAELYFISKVKIGEYEIHNPVRWDALLQKYNMEPINETITTNVYDDNKIKLQIIHNKDHSIFSRVFLNNITILKLKGTLSRILLNNLSILKFSVYYYMHGEEEDPEAKEYLDMNLFSQINEFNLNYNQRIYIEVFTQ